jgi:hypothetical protein
VAGNVDVLRVASVAVYKPSSRPRAFHARQPRNLDYPICYGRFRPRKPIQLVRGRFAPPIPNRRGCHLDCTIMSRSCGITKVGFRKLLSKMHAAAMLPTRSSAPTDCASFRSLVISYLTHRSHLRTTTGVHTCHVVLFSLQPLGECRMIITD